MNNKIFCLVSVFVFSAMLVLGSTVVYAQQTTGRIAKFGPGAPPSLVDSVITEAPISGNIGIGTTTPAAKLHVNGTLRIDNGAFSQSSLGKFDVDAPNVPGGRLRILENGNVGIGTTAPTAKMYVNNLDKSVGTVLATAAEGPAELRVHSYTTQPVNVPSFGIVHAFYNDERNGFIKFWRGGDTFGGFLTFGTSGSERLRIDESGLVGIGTFPGNARLSVLGGNTPAVRAETWIDFPNVPAIQAVSAFSDARNLGLLVFGRTGTTGKLRVDTSIPDNVPTYSFDVGNHSGNGKGISRGWDRFSSRRWKTNIQTIQGAPEKVERLRGVSFDWKEKGGHDIGLIAEEVGEVIPEVVSYEENGKDAMGLDYARLTAVLIEAVKEQQSQIRELKAEIKGLKTLEKRTVELEEKDAEIADLKARLDTLERMVRNVAYQTAWSGPTE